MKFAVIGGDRRAALLCRLLAEDGHRVSSFALERAELPEGLPKAGCLQGCVYGADVVVLPTPAEKSGLLNAPYAATPCPMETLIETLWPGQLLCGGLLGAERVLAAVRGGLTVRDFMKMPGFVTANAALTAEGAVGLLLQESERSLLGNRVLVCGWGRIGRVLCLRLLGMGAHVTLAARSASQRAEARALGCEALDYRDLASALPGCDFAVNTVPARVLSDALLCCLPEGTLLLELASQPGGFDRTAAENLGLRVIAAPGLPGRSAPLAAAGLLRVAIYEVLGEEEA